MRIYKYNVRSRGADWRNGAAVRGNKYSMSWDKKKTNKRECRGYSYIRDDCRRWVCCPLLREESCGSCIRLGKGRYVRTCILLFKAFQYIGLLFLLPLTRVKLTCSDVTFFDADVYSDFGAFDYYMYARKYRILCFFFLGGRGRANSLELILIELIWRLQL